MTVGRQTSSKHRLQVQARSSGLPVYEIFTIDGKSEDRWSRMPRGCCSSTWSSVLERSNHETIIYFDLNLDLPATAVPRPPNSASWPGTMRPAPPTHTPCCAGPRHWALFGPRFPGDRRRGPCILAPRAVGRGGVSRSVPPRAACPACRPPWRAGGAGRAAPAGSCRGETERMLLRKRNLSLPLNLLAAHESHLSQPT